MAWKASTRLPTIGRLVDTAENLFEKVTRDVPENFLAPMALAVRSCSDENRGVLVGLTSCTYGAWSPFLA